jgi:integrase/recombinase XerD
MIMNNIFTGYFSSDLELMLSEKRALGLKYVEQERLMHVFDKLSQQYDCTNGLSKDLVLTFVEKQPHWKRRTQEIRITSIRQIAYFFNTHGIKSYLCDTGRVMKLDEHFKPYIFTHDEIQRIFKEIDSEKAARHYDRNHIFYPVIIRMLYSCGLRISEALNLKIKDVDLKNALIYIIDSKNHKCRTLPMDDSLIYFCEGYLKQIHPVYKDDDYFFEPPSGKKYNKTTVYHHFRKILFKCGISHGGRRNGGPRLHDLRHTFCICSLRQFLENGVDYQTALPILSVYMGHSKLSSTGKYLRLTAEAYPEIAKKLENQYGNIIPDLEVTKNEN